MALSIFNKNEILKNIIEYQEKLLPLAEEIGKIRVLREIFSYLINPKKGENQCPVCKSTIKLEKKEILIRFEELAIRIDEILHGKYIIEIKIEKLKSKLKEQDDLSLLKRKRSTLRHYIITFQAKKDNIKFQKVQLQSELKVVLKNIKDLEIKLRNLKDEISNLDNSISKI